MKNDQVLLTYREIEAWANGVGSLGYLMAALGDANCELEKMLHDSDLIRAPRLPNPDIDPPTIVNCILLWLAMRHG